MYTTLYQGRRIEYLYRGQGDHYLNSIVMDYNTTVIVQIFSVVRYYRLNENGGDRRLFISAVRFLLIPLRLPEWPMENILLYRIGVWELSASNHINFCQQYDENAVFANYMVWHTVLPHFNRSTQKICQIITNWFTKSSKVSAPLANNILHLVAHPLYPVDSK